MTSLGNKRILFCRERERSAAFAQALEEAGAKVQFVAVSQTRPLDPAQYPKLAKMLPRLTAFDVWIFSSANGVDALAALQQNPMFPAVDLSQIPVAVVGERAAQKLRETVPDIKIVAKAPALQALIDRFAAHPGRQTLLHLTSVQSLEKIDLRVPPHLHLERLPIYETVANPHLSPPERAALPAKYDAIIFSSPSSFDHFVQLRGNRRGGENAALVAFGPTTRAHIEKRGCRVAVTPTAPTPAGVCEALTEYFHQRITEEKPIS